MNDIILSIASWLDATDVVHYGSVDTQHYAVLFSNSIWKPLFLSEYDYLAENSLPDKFPTWYSYYKHITKKIKELYKRATVYEIESWLRDEHGNELRQETYDYEEEWMEKINSILPHLGKHFQRGDIIHFEQFDSYRNDGKYIYDGKKLIQLDTDYDDYGQVPEEFKVPQEFPPEYWQLSIEHNVHTSFDKESFIDQLVANIVYKKKYWRTYFYYDHFKYNVWIVWDEDKPNPNNLRELLLNGYAEYENTVNKFGGQSNDIYIKV